MDMLPNCTKDACTGFHKSATKKQFYDTIDCCTWGCSCSNRVERWICFL